MRGHDGRRCQNARTHQTPLKTICILSAFAPFGSFGATRRACAPHRATATAAAPCRPGGHSEGSTPDPIPNSAVKTLRANGTAAQAAEE